MIVESVSPSLAEFMNSWPIQMSVTLGGILLFCIFVEWLGDRIWPVGKKEKPKA